MHPHIKYTNTEKEEVNMAFKLKAPYNIKMMNTPIYRTGKNYNINGEVKENGSMIITDDISDPYQLANTISHEMVHVEQIKSGKLKFDGKNYIYKGKKYPMKNFNTAQQRMKAPWEKEARAAEIYTKHKR